jgi:hypothetical protein
VRPTSLGEMNFRMAFPILSDSEIARSHARLAMI